MRHCSYVASKSLSYQYITNRGRIWDVLRNITTLGGRTDNNLMAILLRACDVIVVNW